jgi:hypothetical protein
MSPLAKRKVSTLTCALVFSISTAAQSAFAEVLISVNKSTQHDTGLITDSVWATIGVQSRLPTIIGVPSRGRFRPSINTDAMTGCLSAWQTTQLSS